jgi:CheY-like chemotaxis protein
MSLIAAIQGFASHGLKRGPSPRRRVLIVDDEEPVRMFVERVLRGAGYETATAGDGAGALGQASKPGSFDILVTDLMMPQMTGDELARRMREVDPRVKVLYLTGFSDHLFKEKVTLWADEAFLDKPCSIKGLLEAVSLLVSGTIPRTDSLAS